MIGVFSVSGSLILREVVIFSCCRECNLLQHIYLVSFVILEIEGNKLESIFEFFLNCGGQGGLSNGI